MIAPPAFLDRVYYGNSLLAWLTALGVLAGVWLALVVVRRLLTRRLERFASRTATSVDDIVLGTLRRTHPAFLVIVALTAAVHVALVLPPNVSAGVELVARLAFLLQAASWGSGAVAFWLARVTHEREARDKASLTTLNVLGVLARVLLYTLLLLLALDAFGIDITALITGLGIAGVAVALAVQNVLGDLLASLAIALDKPFVIGDTINVDQFTGTVDDIGLKTTRLRSLSGERLVFSNADLLKSRIRNFRDFPERRVLFTIGLEYGTSADQVERVPQMIREIIQGESNARLDRTHFSGFGDSALTFETVYYVNSGDYSVFMDTQQRIYLALLRAVEGAGLSFAFPTRTVVLTRGERAARPAERA